MGRAIDMEKDIDKLKSQLARLESAFEGIASTVETLQDTAPARKNIDLHKKSDARNVKAVGKKKELVEEAEA